MYIAFSKNLSCLLLYFKVPPTVRFRKPRHAEPTGIHRPHRRSLTSTVTKYMSTIELTFILLGRLSIHFHLLTSMRYEFVSTFFSKHFIPFLQMSPKLETAPPAPTVPITITHQTAQKNLSQSPSGASAVAPAPSQQNSTVGDSVHTTASSSSDGEASSPAVTAVSILTTTHTGKEADIKGSHAPAAIIYFQLIHSLCLVFIY